MADDRLAELIRHHAADGITETAWARLRVVCLREPMPRRPVVYMPSLCVVAQGRKCALIGNRRCVYDKDNYLVCSMTLPIESEVEQASPRRPFLAALLLVDPTLVGQLLLEMDSFASHRPPLATRQAVATSPMDPQLRAAFTRLLEIVDRPMDREILGPSLEREILYTALRTPQGQLLRGCVLREGSAHRVADVVRFVEDNYRESLDIASLAKRAGMSPSALHHHFKQATALSPMQFVKRLRLHRAHALLISGRAAGEAAFEVGYASASQFSREFRRMFGHPPNQARAQA